MKHLKNGIFLLGCMAVGFGIAKAYLAWKEYNRYSFEHHEGTQVTGVGDAPANRGYTIRDPGTNIGQLAGAWQEGFATAVGIEYSPSWTHGALASATKAAHARHMTVTLLPAPNFGKANPYPKGLQELAGDAQSAHVDMLCVSWINQPISLENIKYWGGEVAAVRKVFSGKVILAVTAEVAPGVTCWGLSDYIGIAGPVAIPRRLPHAGDEVNVHDFRVMWDCELTSLDSLSRRLGKKVALLNVDVPATYAVKMPVVGTTVKPVVNVQAQEMVYEAGIVEMKGRSSTIDVMLMPWGNADAPNVVPGLMGKVAEAWDPKKPRAVETAPAETQEGDADMAEGVDVQGGGDGGK
jgi:hypothetical protein